MKHFWFGDKIETSLHLFFFNYFQGSEFSRSASGCHENSDPGKQIKKKDLSSLWSCNVHKRQQPARKDWDIYPSRFITVASRGYKHVWLQFEQHYSHSVFNFYFFRKTSCRQMSWHVLKLDLNSTWWMPKLVSIDAQSYAALMSQSLPATIGPL